MKQIEYKMVKYEQGFVNRLFGDFEEGIMQVLSEQGQEGWDLKEIILMGGMPPLFIFSREAA